MQKIHGEREFAEMLRVLDICGVRHIYFKGSDINTWADGIGACRTAVLGKENVGNA